MIGIRKEIVQAGEGSQGSTLTSLEARCRNQIFLEGDLPQLKLDLFHISSFRRNYLSTLSRYRALPEYLSEQPINQLLFAQAHTRAGNHQEAKDVLSGVEPASGDVANNKLGMAAEIACLEKDVDVLEDCTSRLFPEEHTSREYFRYRSMIYELQDGPDALEHFLKTALTKDLLPKVEAAVASLLAKQCDRKGDFSQAFAYAAQSGQALLRTQVAVDQLALADRIIEASHGSEVQDHGGDARPVFVVGMPRSGTTLLESVLMAHPQADGVGESPDPVAMIELACHRLRCSLPELHHKLDASLLVDFANEQLPRLHAAGAEGDRIVNKSLWLDRYVGILASMFPGAKFIWIHRDPRDNLLSCFLHYIGAPQATTVPELIKSRLAHEKLMRHWQSRYPARVLEVGYESLVSNFDREVKRLLEFLDLPYHEDCLQFYQSDRLAMTPSRDQVRQPINRNAVDRGKNYEPFWSEVLEAFPAGRVSIPN